MLRGWLWEVEAGGGTGPAEFVQERACYLEGAGILNCLTEGNTHAT